jgi:hypothetical protein
MPDSLSLKDVVYVYVRLSSVSFELQRTRSSFRVFKNGILSIGHGLHLGVDAKPQHLVSSQKEKKDFQKAVSEARGKLDSFAAMQNHKFQPNSPVVREMISFVNYAQSARPADEHIAGDRQGGLADRNKIAIDRQQIRSLLMLNRKWNQEDMESCGTWPD